MRDNSEQRPAAIEKPARSVRTGGPFSFANVMLFDIARALLAVALARQRFLGTALFARLQIERVALDLLDYIFLLDLALEAAQRTLERFALLQMYFCQLRLTAFLVPADCGGHGCNPLF
jgi:hypothetical protein